jgi:hypothetical protein
MSQIKLFLSGNTSDLEGFTLPGQNTSALGRFSLIGRFQELMKLQKYFRPKEFNE